ncbi:hypothetical protein WISP_137690 [Willisornis vidua]|uniref:Uncharacterized protein n=1 Tax=Willisornis vidua TaxID=1566151 RepID=A0ABQ9CTW1_9PASS|nr:hypothetical protein WISP_137690 [Willisornis vidua]
MDQTLLSGAKQQDKREQADTDAQEFPPEHEEELLHRAATTNWKKFPRQGVEFPSLEIFQSQDPPVETNLPNRLLIVVIAFAGVCNKTSHDGEVVVHIENLIDEHVTNDMKHDKCASSHFIHHYKWDSLHLLGVDIQAEQIEAFLCQR